MAVQYQRAAGPLSGPVFNRLVESLNLQKERDDRRFQELEKCIEGLEERVKKLEERD